MKYINADNLFDYAFINEDTLKKPLKGICFEFHGFTDGSTFTESTQHAKWLGEKGIAWVFPYYSVWAWGSDNSAEFINQVVDAVFDRLNASNNIPVVVLGGSMGGLTALNFVRVSDKNIVACAGNCPVIDVVDGFAANPDWRRAIVSSHIEKNVDINEVLENISPAYFADQLPKIPYRFVYGVLDTYFHQVQMPIAQKVFAENGLDLRVHEEQAMAHCNISDFPELYRSFYQFLICEVYKNETNN